MDRIYINDKVKTPDGLGIVKEMKELGSGEIGFTCLLEKPFVVHDPWDTKRDYDYPSYSFGYMYSQSQIEIHNN